MALRVVHYTAERVPNPHPLGEPVTEDEEMERHDLFYDVNFAICNACQKLGLTGPDDHDLENDNAAELWYFVIDDMHNYELYQYVEIYKPEACSMQWLARIVGVLKDYPGWGVGVRGLRSAYLLIFADRLMVTGPTFEHCHDVGAVMRAAAENLREARAE